MEANLQTLLYMQSILFNSICQTYYVIPQIFSIDKFIDFVDNESLRNTYEKTAKIKPLHNLLVKCFQTIYKPEKDISIDESLLLWKVMFSWKQYIPNKGSRFGMRAFILSEVDSGYIWTASSTMGKN